MRSLLGRFHRPFARSVEEQLLLLNNLGDGSTLSLDFTTGVLDTRLTFTRSTTGTFTNASGLVASAAINTPRFDYDPSTRQPRGLLIEGSASNLLTYSNDFANAVWLLDNSGAANPAVSTVSQIGPDGAATVTRITFNKTGGTFSRIRNSAVGSASQPYTMSVWMKANTASGGAATQNVGLRIGADPAGFNCVVTTTWKRFQYTYTLSGTDANAQIMLWDSIVGNDETADVLVYGCQIEAGSGASSYIPTGASTGSRAVDVCTMSSITALNYNANGGTLFAHFSNNTENANFAGSIGFNNGANYAQRFLWGSGALLGFYVRTNGTTTLGSYLNGSRTSFASAKAATSYSFDGTTTSTAMSINGAQATTTPTSSAVSGVSIATAFALNSDNSSAATAYPSLAVRSVKFYPTALTMAQMNAITANP